MAQIEPPLPADSPVDIQEREHCGTSLSLRQAMNFTWMQPAPRDGTLWPTHKRFWPESVPRTCSWKQTRSTARVYALITQGEQTACLDRMKRKPPQAWGKVLSCLPQNRGDQEPQHYERHLQRQKCSSRSLSKPRTRAAVAPRPAPQENTAGKLQARHPHVLRQGSRWGSARAHVTAPHTTGHSPSHPPHAPAPHCALGARPFSSLRRPRPCQAAPLAFSWDLETFPLRSRSSAVKACQMDFSSSSLRPTMAGPPAPATPDSPPPLSLHLFWPRRSRPGGGCPPLAGSAGAAPGAAHGPLRAEGRLGPQVLQPACAPRARRSCPWLGAAAARDESSLPWGAPRRGMEDTVWLQQRKIPSRVGFSHKGAV